MAVTHRHQVQHYSNQLAKETNQYLKELTHLPASGTQSEQVFLLLIICLYSVFINDIDCLD